MKIRFTELSVAGFKSYVTETKFQFGFSTNIKGRNGSGKSSIGEAIPWVLFGTDTFGDTLDPANVFKEIDTHVTLSLLDSEGSEHILTRSIVKGKNKFYINEAPVKATEYKQVIESLFNKEEFLTLFNPTYFFTQHWTAQRQQVMTHVKEPLNADILNRLPKTHREGLEAELKRYKLDKIEAKHRDIKKSTDHDIIRLRERLSTLETMNEPKDASIDVVKLQNELEKLNLQIKAHMGKRDKYEKDRKAHETLVREADRLYARIQEQVAIVNKLQKEEFETNCSTCGQELTEQAKATAENQKLTILTDAKAKGKALVMERKEVMEQLKTATMPETPVDVMAIQEKAMNIREQLAQNQATDYSKDIEKTKAELMKMKAENIDSTLLIDAIKMFSAEKAHFMVSEVNNLFDKISVKLFEMQKNGEEKATFEIEYDGKPYSKLSTAEKILAGLEFKEALSELMQKDLPVFIDNFESISGNACNPSGQVLTSKVSDADLEITKVGEAV